MANQLGDFRKYAPNFQRCVQCGQDVPSKAARTPRGDGFPSSPAMQYVVKLSRPLATFRRYYSIAVFGYIRLNDVDVVTVGIACVVVH